MIRLHVRPLADADSDAAADYYVEIANIDIAIRFQNALDRAYDRLLQHPHIGTQISTFLPKLAGLRFWPVPGFERYLIFYMSSHETIDIVRVLHSARDLSILLAETE